MSAILNFYSNPAKIQEILDQSDEWWEKTHDFIQWIFPLPEPSKAQPQSPVATQQDLLAIGDSLDMRALAKRCYLRFLEFLDLEYKDGAVVPKVEDLWWMTRRDHNYLRITRCIRFLTLIGMENQANDFLMCLRQLYNGRYSLAIGWKTIEYWNAAFIVSFHEARRMSRNL